MIQPVSELNRDALISEGEKLVAAEGYDLVGQAKTALRWAHEKFGNDLVIASSMGDEVLVYLAEQEIPGAHVVFIDTGYHFSETLALRNQVALDGKVKVESVLPLLTIGQQSEIHGKDLWFTNPDACCAIRKVEPLERTLVIYSAWVAGLRRVDAPTRKDIDVITWDSKREKLKVNPLANWGDEFLQKFTDQNPVKVNALRGRSFTSIGCEPCTRPTAAGEDPRAGRWSGTTKIECGLHT